MTRILHISDLHDTSEAPRSEDIETIVKSLLADVASEQEQTPVELVVMSGDVAFSGDSAQFAHARQLLLDPLQDLLDLPRDALVLVPGNHDVEIAQVDPDIEPGLLVGLDSRDALNRLMADPARVERACLRLQNWDTFRSSYYDGCDVQQIPPLGWLHQRDAGAGVRIKTAALNTAWRSTGIGDEERGRLLLGDQQLTRAVAEIEDADLRLVVFHHPEEWLAQWDADEVRRIVAGAGVVLLTGHDHVPDPTLELTIRGSLLHSRGGCLYGSFKYRNGYAFIDVDLEKCRTGVRLRSWFPDRRTFDQGVDLTPGGEIQLEWPRPPSAELAVVPQATYSLVMSNLAAIVQQRSIISDYLGESHREIRVDDVLVSPRLWPIPYREAVAVAARGQPKAERVDNLELVTGDEVVIVAGEPESGITGTLLWLLAQRYGLSVTHLPVYVPFDTHFKDTRFAGALRRELGRYGVAPSGDRFPPLIVAVDDVAPAHSGALGAFVRFVRENPQNTFILGAHGDEAERMSETLEGSGVRTRVVYLGPFGRQELRNFVEKLTGAPSSELVERVTRILQTERLPRNPFIITALVTVIVKNIELAEVNESSLLDAYVSFLLGQGETVDMSGTQMDYRRREHLLEMFARHLGEEDRLSLPRMDFEEFVLKYFRDRDWGDRLSPGKVSDDLIARRVLHESVEGAVGFRHPAFRALFAGKAMIDDSAFADRMISQPLANENAVRHAAGLKRSDPNLLRSYAAATRAIVADSSDGFDADMFDLVKLKPGWSHDHPNAEELAERLEVPLPEPPPEEEVDAQVDRYHDDLDFHEREITERDPVDNMWTVARALGAILRNSELVDDVQLKTEVLKAVLDDWGVFAVMAAVKEDREGAVAEQVVRLLQDRTDGEVDREAVARMIDLLIVFMTVIVVQSSLSTVHLEGTVRRVLDDDEFMSTTVHALLTTFLYAALGADDWPERMQTLYQTHVGHPVVAELITTYSLAMYRMEALTEGETTKLEAFLGDVYAGDAIAASGISRSMAQAQRRDRAIKRLRRQRLIDKARGHGQARFDDLLDDEDEGGTPTETPESQL
jgi:hypothetical protein